MKFLMMKEKIKSFYILIFLAGIVLAACYFYSSPSPYDSGSRQVSELKSSNDSEKVFFDAPVRIGITPPDIKSSSSASNK